LFELNHECLAFLLERLARLIAGDASEFGGLFDAQGGLRRFPALRWRSFCLPLQAQAEALL